MLPLPTRVHVALVVVVALASSPRLRKSTFIWASYATITSWYYFRVLHKKYSGTNDKEALDKSPQSKTRTISASPQSVDGPRDPDLVYFESKEVVTRRQQEERLERSGVSERSSHMSESGSSSGSDGSGTRNRKKSFFHSRRKAAAEEAMRRVSDASSNDLLTSSNASEDPVTPGRNSTARRTYVGRKKPVSWAE
ncbi:hypothetical protein BBO99_00009102 [Phytophthora kernoviae]|uniref:Uncharacterized protein n=2 Tax=Phytophthora kernoviae TaxID=325452 RepID=A0A3R7GRH3_9STRA|nr:hypothetical protein G195_003634 [Phytophthora kernoviae 00238/432]KAG2509852.1 hypothetical protein JM16_008604 [Phytophthora kernoviae]KAG2511712.1 hypothetical protein JM18_008634 [Phytophthora kernoviae]RLN32333.1 hypothetical protein BBI17_009055 [Phytophthora kernoviae]RLN74096.1 hypothetical protein BBO99_00009102 [Phytophthora kernoviae]